MVALEVTGLGSFNINGLHWKTARAFHWKTARVVRWKTAPRCHQLVFDSSVVRRKGGAFAADLPNPKTINHVSDSPLGGRGGGCIVPPTFRIQSDKSEACLRFPSGKKGGRGGGASDPRRCNRAGSFVE